MATPSMAALVILLRLTGLLQNWEWDLYDLYMRSRPQEPRDQRIAIVGIDENDLSQRNESIISDSALAELLEKLKAQKPRAIGIDIYRDLPVPPGHETLVQLFATTPNLVGIQKVGGEFVERETVAPPPVLKEKDQVGANDLIFDADNRTRRGLIYLNDANEETVYSFSLHLALHYLEAEGIAPEMGEEIDHWQLGKTLFSPLSASDGGYVRTDAGGYQLLINYRGGDRTFETVSMTDVLEGLVPPDWARDRVILIGKVGESFKDLFFIPYSTGLVGLPRPVAGVEIHANLTSQLISAALEGRPLIKTWPEPLEWLWVLFWSGTGAAVTWRLRYADGVNSFSPKRWGALLGAGGILVGSTYLAFLQGWWIPVVPPLIALVSSAAVITAYLARTAIELRETFGRYLTDQVVANLMENPSARKLGGERRQLTILTSDLRGFTATSERLQPEEVIKILNFYLGHMAEVITHYQGTIDEFMGDGILVLFGAPTQKRDDAERAIACAVAMQMAMKPVNEQMKQWDLPKLEMGIGIHTGEVVVGNIGSEKRTKYGVVGAHVNLTYRIESYTTGGQVLISESTLEQAGEMVIIEAEKKVQPKGVKEPISIYQVGGIRGNYNLLLPQDIETFLPLARPIPLLYSLLDGKHVGDSVYNGDIIELSQSSALVCCNHGDPQGFPALMSNIKLNFVSRDRSDQVSEDVYAKVLEKSADNGNFYLRFTAKPPIVAKQLDELYETLKSHCEASDLVWQ